MTDWTARARAHFSERPTTPTAKTDETPSRFPERPRGGTDKTDRTPVSSVSSVEGWRLPEKTRVQACRGCRHRTRAGTCAEPVAAGLLPEFELVWPEPSHAATCPAWRRDPHEAVVAVHIAAALHLWPEATRAAWLADADEHPEATLEALRNGVTS